MSRRRRICPEDTIYRQPALQGFPVVKYSVVPRQHFNDEHFYDSRYYILTITNVAVQVYNYALQGTARFVNC